MIYAYHCENCNIDFDVVKSVEDYNREERCKCGSVGRKLFFTSKPIIDKHKAEYYPTFGKVINSKAHLKEEVKRTGAIEVGNEKPETIHKEMKALNEHIRNKRYDEI
jgi:hypothetical protein